MMKHKLGNYDGVREQEEEVKSVSHRKRESKGGWNWKEKKGSGQKQHELTFLLLLFPSLHGKVRGEEKRNI